MKKHKIVIIGGGMVGSSFAHQLVVGDLCDELVLIDINERKMEADSLDFLHALPYLASNKKQIYAGNFTDCVDADLIAITANAPTAQFDDAHDRLTLLKSNVEMISEIVSNVRKSGFDGIFLVATNPCDLITQAVANCSNLPKNRVIGTGTLLETSRLRHMIGEQLNMNPQNVHGFVLGEHGKSSFTAWSTVNIGGQNITKYQSNLTSFEQIDQEIRDAGFRIHSGKGNTSYGIAAMLERLARAILHDEQIILPVSTFDEKHQMYVGWPAIIDQTGIRERLDLALTADEWKKYENSVKILQENWQTLKSEK